MEKTNRPTPTSETTSKAASKALIAPSFVQCTWPMFGCLVAAEKFLGEDRTWHPQNEVQAAFLAGHFVPNRAIDLDVVESMASESAGEVMAWLAQRGFTVQIQPYKRSLSELEFGVASVLDLLLKWPEGTAERYTIRVRDDEGEETGQFPGVKVSMVNFYQAPDHRHPIMEVLTREERTHLYMTVLDAPPSGEFGLVDLARQLGVTKAPMQHFFRGGVFPMIHLEEERELEWVKGMSTPNALMGDMIAFVRKAVQINRLRMNEEGVRAQSAVHMRMVRTLGAIPMPYVIDRPFLLWIERDGIAEPLYVAWLDHDAWKDPGGLG